MPRANLPALLCALGLLLLGAAAPAKAMTVEEFLATGKARPKEWLEAYFIGLRDAVYDYNTAMQAAGIKVFCPVENEPPMSSDELRRRIEALIASRETETDFDSFSTEATLGLVSVQILNQALPCPTTGEEGSEEEPADGQQP